MARVLLSLLAISCGPAVEPAHLLYSRDAASLQNPFPDLRLVARPSFYAPFLPPKAVNKPMRQLLDGYASALTTVEGVGNFGPTLLPVTDRIDRTSLDGAFTRLVQRAGGWEVLEASVPAESSRDLLLAEGRAVPDDFPEFVLVRPTVVLPEGASGMLVALKGPRTESGAALGRGFEAPESDCRTAAHALGIPEQDVLLALPLRGAPVSARFEKIVAWADGAAPAAMRVGAHGMKGDLFDGRWAPGDADWGQLQPWLEKWRWARPADQVGAVLFGTFPSRDLRDDGVWRDEWVENPSLAPAVELRFVLSVPKGVRPAGGWPFIVGAHGMNARNTTSTGSGDSFCLELAQLFAREGYACVGIDAPSHGSRGSAFDFFAVDNLAKARENFRQMVVDQMQLVRALPLLDVDGDGAGDFQRDASYFGNSLGAIMGANFAAVDPRVRTTVLNVPGGGLSNILTGDEIRDRIGLLLVAKTSLAFQSPEYFATFPFFRAAAQLVIDPGDPINVGRMLGSDRALLAQEGIGDVTIPNFTTEELARSMALEPVEGARTGAGQHLLFRADPKAYLPAARAAGYNGHGLMWEDEAGALRAQAMRFLLTQGHEFHPEGLAGH